MGSLTSSPKAPRVAAPVIAPVPTPQVSAPVPAPESTSNEPSAEERSAQARRSTLLNRDRGRLGTITTSFRGLLGLGNRNDQGRKTLLGE